MVLALVGQEGREGCPTRSASLKEIEAASIFQDFFKVQAANMGSQRCWRHCGALDGREELQKDLMGKGWWVCSNRRQVGARLRWRMRQRI